MTGRFKHLHAKYRRADYTSHRHKLSFSDGRLDDNNMKDVTTEIIPFASLRPCAFALNQERKDARAQRTKSAVYAGVEYILLLATPLKPIGDIDIGKLAEDDTISEHEHSK